MSTDRKLWIQNENKSLSEKSFSKTINSIPTVTQTFQCWWGLQGKPEWTHSFSISTVWLRTSTESWGGDKGQLTQGPAVEAAHEGEHGVVRAARGLQAEHTVGSVRGSHPPHSPLSSSSIRHHKWLQPPLQQVHWSPPKPTPAPKPWH